MPIAPDFATFRTLAQQGNFVPVYQAWIADLETPVSAWYRTCAGHPYNFLLESVEGGERLGRYSFLGCDPIWVLHASGDGTTQTHRDGTCERHSGNPFQILQACLADIQPVKLAELPPGLGGLFGVWGYEAIRWIEPSISLHPTSARELPDGVWMQVDRLIAFDQIQRRIWAIAYADLRDPATDCQAAYERASACVRQLVDELQQPLPAQATLLRWAPPPAAAPPRYDSNTTQARFCDSVRQAQAYIRAGDIFQVSLSQRLSATYPGHPFELYRALRAINPSPYMAYYSLGDWQLIGSSPEVMVKASRDGDGELQATLRPIAGTRPRGETPAQDEALAQALRSDPKEIAEHVMLVDLGRNDLGRACQTGSVRVDELMAIERYSRVMHLVSNITGKLTADRGAWDLFAACFPAGTVTGTPKIRAMELINELEPEPRGPYAGAYGYYDFEGQLNTAIAIRTMVVQPGEGSQRVSVQAGAGVVADSEPEQEYQETLNKARALLEAIRGLQGQ